MIKENLSALILGASGFGSGIPRDRAFSIMDAFLENRGNTIDTAAVYGMGVSEKTVGEWMRERGARSKVFISTKGGHPSLPDWNRRITEKDIRSDMEDSLRNLQSDYVDIYFLHRDDETRPVEEIMPILDRLVCEGKTRYIGASNWTAARINEANAFARENGMAEFSVSQIFWNGAVINKDGVSDKTLVVMDDVEHTAYSENKIPVMAYTSQARGLFSHIHDKGYDALPDAMKRTYINGATKERAERILAVAAEKGISPTAVSLAYLLFDKTVKGYPIIGTSRPERILEALQVLTLEEKDVERLFL